MSHGHTVFDKHRCNLLIHGYIGDIAKLFNNKTIPLSISEMILVYYFITFDSVILNSKDTQMFVQLLQLADTKRNIETEFESEYKLLYRATNDGWKYDTFFDKCKDAKQTLTIIQTDSNNVFGGYTSIPWRNDNRWRVDDAAFLFLIRSSKQYKPQIFPLISSQRQYAVCHFDQYLCTFGLGHDIYMFEKDGQMAFTQTKQCSYDIPTPHYLNGDEHHFKPVQLEVFEVEYRH
eukprot:573951_1